MAMGVRGPSITEVERRLNAARRSRLDDGLRQLGVAIDALSALENRLRTIEDALTSGDALALPEVKLPKDPRADAEARLAAAAHLIGAVIRRMNLRVGALEQAIDGRAPLGLDDGIELQSPRRVAALESGALKTPARATQKSRRRLLRPERIVASAPIVTRPN